MFGPSVPVPSTDASPLQVSKVYMCLCVYFIYLFILYYLFYFISTFILQLADLTYRHCLSILVLCLMLIHII